MQKSFKVTTMFKRKTHFEFQKCLAFYIEKKKKKNEETERRKERKKEGKQVAQGQYVVSDTRCPALSDCKMEWP